VPKFTCLTIQCLTELVDWRGHLQPLNKNSTLTLQTDILWPSNETAQIPLWLNVLTCENMIWRQVTETNFSNLNTNSKVASFFLKERVHNFLWDFFLDSQRCWCNLLADTFLSLLKKYSVSFSLSNKRNLKSRRW
jgi:hypothetical protein